MYSTFLEALKFSTHRRTVKTLSSADRKIYLKPLIYDYFSPSSINFLPANVQLFIC